MKSGWVAVLMLVPFALAGLLIRCSQSGFFAPPDRPAMCMPRFGNYPPLRVDGIRDAKAIQLESRHLLAVDGEGNAWSRDEYPTASCTEPTPKKILSFDAFSRLFPNTGKPEQFDPAGLRTDKGVVVDLSATSPPMCELGSKYCHAPLRYGPDQVALLASGGMHRLYVRQDGSLWSDGNNACGQLGRRDHFHLEDREALGEVPGLKSVVMATAGLRSSMVLDASGRVWVFGNMAHPSFGSTVGTRPVPTYTYCHEANRYNEPYSNLPQDVPQRVTGLPPIKAISSYYATNLALDRDGHVWGWGFNTCGQVGSAPADADDPMYYMREPRRIEGLPTIVAIAMGKRHALALDNEGRVWAWGENSDMELGPRFPPPDSLACTSEGESTAYAGFRSVPQVVPGIPKAVKIAAGLNSSAAIDEHGDIWLWGRR